MRSVIPLIVLVPLLASAPARAFDAAELKGTWAESTQSRYACTPANRRQTLELSPDGKSLKITILHRAASRPHEVLSLDVVKTDEHSVYFHFPGTHVPPDPMAGEWAISMLGPGVYRWHMTSAHETAQPAPVGVRCEP